MRFGAFAQISAAMVVIASFLAACVVVEEPTRPWPPSSGEPQMCTREYAPVCGQRGNDRQTFGNACLARADGYRIVSQGECRRGGRPEPVVCTMDYRPVCAQRGGDRRTFSNSCMAGADGYRVVHDGECRGGGTGGGSQVSCSREYAPVCARRRGDVRTFGNACMAQAENYRIIYDGQC